jgi:hypothetical protein
MWKEFEHMIALKSPDRVTLTERAVDDLLLMDIQRKDKLREYVGIRTHFIHFHSLPSEYSFDGYMKDCFNILFERTARISWRNGIVLLLWSFTFFIFSSIIGDQASSSEPSDKIQKSNLLVVVASTFINWVLMILGIISQAKSKAFVSQLVAESQIPADDLRLLHSESLRLMTMQGIAENYVDRKEVEDEKEADFQSPVNVSVNEEEEEENNDNVSTLAMLTSRVPASFRKRNKLIHEVLCPFIFESDPYIMKFPFAIPNFLVRATQVWLGMQSVQLCLVFTIFVFLMKIDWVSFVFFALAITPSLYFFFSWIHVALPLLVMLRYSGPIAKQALIKKHI